MPKFAASSLSLGVPGTVAARLASSSMKVGSRASRTMSQSGWTSTVVGGIPRQTSWTKDSTLLSSGVVLAKEGVTYCTNHRNHICGSGVANQIRS